MLLSYRFSNFCSFLDTTNVSLELNERDKVLGWTRRTPSGKRVTTALAVVGANGAGKSSLVKVGAFLNWFLRDSFNVAVGEAVPFMAHMANAHGVSEFAIELENNDGVEWTYEVRFVSGFVLSETLHRRPAEPRKKRELIFFRELKGKRYDVVQKGGDLTAAEIAKLRNNVSIVSWARQTGSPIASDFVQTPFVSNLGLSGKAESSHNDLWRVGTFFKERRDLWAELSNLMRRLDFGLTDVKLRKYEQPNPQGEARDRWYPIGVHEAKGKTFELPFFYESAGTQKALVLLSHVLDVLNSGGLAFVDELDCDLHPMMLEPFLRLFHDEKTNPKGAQIVFTCQSPEVFRLLQRSQVMFVEKEDCISQAYRGDEIKGLTSEHNLYAKYMTGALGGVPRL